MKINKHNKKLNEAKKSQYCTDVGKNSEIKEICSSPRLF